MSRARHPGNANNSFGLPQGFVRFDSTHYLVLQKLHELGDMRHNDLMEELGIETRKLATSLMRLTASKFIFRVDLAVKRETGERTQWMYSLRDKRKNRKFWANTNSEKVKLWRDNKRARVASVFDFRGQIHV